MSEREYELIGHGQYLQAKVIISMLICSDLRADRQSGKSGGDPDAKFLGHGGKRDIHFRRGAAQY